MINSPAFGFTGDIGFEPINAGVRVQCLAVWRIPNNAKNILAQN